MTTLDPGARVVFTHGLRDSPASTAFLASSAAPTMTDGFEVLVHEVMAAITTRAVIHGGFRAVVQDDVRRRGRAAGTRLQPPDRTQGTCRPAALSRLGADT